MALASKWQRSAWLMLLAATACGEGDGPASKAQASASRQVRACDVLTRADAETALGHAVEQLPNDGGPAGLDICQYGYQGERLTDGGNVSVTLKPVDIASLRKAVDETGASTEPVPGLGDSAFWTPDYGLYVGKGNQTAIYLLGAGGMSDAKARSVALAQATSSRF